MKAYIRVRARLVARDNVIKFLNVHCLESVYSTALLWDRYQVFV